MNHYFIILGVAAIAGGLMGLLLRWAMLSRLPLVLQRLAGALAADLSDSVGPSFGEANFEHVRPLIEGHVDDFLGHKLPKEMPMIGMFIGEKTITQLKGIFMKELEEIFPPVMKKYIGGLPMQTLISQKIESLSSKKFRVLLNKYGSTEMNMIPICGVICGLVTGTLQLLIILLVP